jgi:hypothetical protein
MSYICTKSFNAFGKFVEYLLWVSSSAGDADARQSSHRGTDRHMDCQVQASVESRMIEASGRT